MTFFSIIRNANDFLTRIMFRDSSLDTAQQKWWSTENAYITKEGSPDFIVVRKSTTSGSMGSMYSNDTRTARSSVSTTNKTKKLKSIAVQTDGNELNDDVVQSIASLDQVSMMSSNFVIDSFSAPNLTSGASGILSNETGSFFQGNYTGASVDRGIDDKLSRKFAKANNRSYEITGFTKKKKVNKKIVLPRLDYLSTPPTPQTDFTIAGHNPKSTLIRPV